MWKRGFMVLATTKCYECDINDSYFDKGSGNNDNDEDTLLWI